MFPTPTPFSGATEALILINPDSYGMWAYAPSVVQVWNYASREFSATVVIQIAIIVVMVIALIPLVMRWAAWIDASRDRSGE